MKRYLLLLFFIVGAGIFLIFSHQNAFAQLSGGSADQTPPTWVQDQEVTFVGKMAARADTFLNWTLQNYDWMCVQKETNGKCTENPLDPNNPLLQFWVLVRNVVYASLALFVLVTAFILIITHGENLTIMKFIPRFVLIIVFVTLSFYLVEFIYVIVDIIQGWLLQAPGGNQLIGSQDLFHIAFDYKTFIGFRAVGQQYDESAFISLLLVRLTAFTYYAMIGILLIRKIILWFFIIISPIFPLLLFYAPIRNTAKIWVGEFFRWLLYAPLFALFLHGLVGMWVANKAGANGIPLPFDFSNVGQVIYPTAVNILIAGPGQKIFFDPSNNTSNSVNLPDTFALYVVALLMLWVVILLPFLLLNIFLDYLGTISLRDNLLLKQLMSKSYGLLPRYAAGPQPPTLPPNAPQGAGAARALPFLANSVGSTRTIPVGVGEARVFTSAPLSSIQNAQSTSELMNLTNLAIPKMRDIAKFETGLLSKDTGRRQEVSRMNSTLQHIANPTMASNPIDREKFNKIREKLVQQKQKGDQVASSILSASSMLSQRSPATHMNSAALTQQKEKLVTKLNTTADGKEKESLRSQISEINRTLEKEAFGGQNTALSQVMQQVSQPQQIVDPTKREAVTKLREKIVQAQQSGDPVAIALMNNTAMINQQTSSQGERDSVINKVRENLAQEKAKGNSLASEVLAEVQKIYDEDVKSQQILQAASTHYQSPVAPVALPAVNRVQQVSIEEYEDVKKMWIENYQKLDVPQSVTGGELDRKQWIKNDIDKIDMAIVLLMAVDLQKNKEGMDMVGNILPFLLIGGFSKTEVVAYLKAKLEAAKQVLSVIGTKEEEEDTLVDAAGHKHEQAGAQQAHKELLNDEEKKVS